MFGRKKKTEDTDPAAEPGAPSSVDSAAAAGEGPWDLASAPEDDIARVDLGSLQIPALPGVEIRVEAGPDGEIVAAALAAGSSALELGVFAAPRSAGIWDEVRGEIAASLREQGSEVTEQEGAFGPELVTGLQTPQGVQKARFVGVDGPRWFVRGLFTGPAATNPTQAGLLTRSMRELVVNRGDEAMPVRDPLPLTVPVDAMQEAEDAGRHSADDEGADGDERRTLPPPERGPEITETR